MNTTKIRSSVKTRRIWSGYPEGKVLRPTPSELETLRSQIERCRELHKERFHDEDYPFWSNDVIALYLKQ